ncbi:titin homolog [Carassius carassius]|uniref:titin homolog n=1 Tax=Carassius carassius TaxID=217509 RepID=UPI0028685EC5|nr:titin homolog [Carassius carassius]
MALFRGLFEWVQCFVHRIPRRRKKQGVQKCTEAECTPMEGMSRPLDVGNTDQKNQSSYCKASKNLNDKDKREVGRKRKLKKERKMVDERESGRMEEETKDPTPLRIEVKPQPTPPAAEVKTPASSSFLKSVKGPLVAKRACRHLLPLATKTRPPSSGEEPMLVQKASRQLAQPATESLAVPTPKQVMSMSPDEEPQAVQRASQHLAPSAEEPSVAEPLVLQHTTAKSLSLSMEEQLMEQVMFPSRQIPKCAELKPKPATSSLIQMDTESEEDESVEHTDRTLPSSESETNHKQRFVKVHPLVLDQSDDFRKKKCGDSKADASRKSKELDELMMRLFCVDFSNAPKKESQQHLKLKNQPALEAGVKQKALFEKVHPIVLEQSGDSGKKKCADSKDDDLQNAKELDEQMMRLFYVDYSPCPKKEKQQPSREGQEKPKKRGKTRTGLFSWAQKRLKTITEEDEESEKDEKT